ncbi:MAG: HAD family phosphatase [Pseudobutyrivibrio sp.]|nr:HAD family phosphatase [Pseudobutyrivibrio sp.]
MEGIKAVLFDLDGTLTDTEKYYQKAWPIAMSHFGYTMTNDQFLQIRSLGRPFATEQFKEWYGQDFDYWQVRNYRKELIEEMFKDGIPLKPGAVEILTWLKERGYTITLVTANDKERATRYLKKIGLYEYFDELACADMVKQGKPAPDIYQHACQMLGVKPEETVAVEDSPNGIRSCYGAGCHPIMIPDLSQPDEELEKLLYAKLDCLLDLKNIL